MDEDKIVETIARTLSVVATNNPNLRKPGEQLPQAAWEHQPRGWCDRCTKEAQAIWIAAKAALAESGYIIIPSCMIDEFARVKAKQREIEQGAAETRESIRVGARRSKARLKL